MDWLDSKRIQNTNPKRFILSGFFIYPMDMNGPAELSGNSLSILFTSGKSQSTSLPYPAPGRWMEKSAAELEYPVKDQ